MFTVKHLLATLVVVAAALAAATSALGWQGPPVVNEQFRPPPDVHPLLWCGEVQGTAVDTTVEHYRQDASGNIIDNARFSRVFTATATRKSIFSTASTTAKSQGPIGNGDGTISFVTAINGLALKFQVLNGSVLKAADGEPLRSAGILMFEDLFDAATGDYIRTNVSFQRSASGCRGRGHLWTVGCVPARSLGLASGCLRRGRPAAALSESAARAVRFYFGSNRPIAHVAQDMGVHKEALRQWVRPAQGNAELGRANAISRSGERAVMSISVAVERLSVSIDARPPFELRLGRMMCRDGDVASTDDRWFRCDHG